MEEKELFYYQKALGLLKLGMTKEVLEKELTYFKAADHTAAIKGYQKALSQIPEKSKTVIT